jgi:hypothetical protein
VAFVLSSLPADAAVATLGAEYLLPLHAWRVLFLLCGAAVVIAIGYIWLRMPKSEMWHAQCAGRPVLADLLSPNLLHITLLGSSTLALERFPTYIRATGLGFCFNIGRGISALAPLALSWASPVFGFTLGIVLCGCLLLLSAAVVGLLPKEPGKQGTQLINTR